MNYYNENSTTAAAWLRELIRAGEIGNGVVDERSICDVKADELRDYNQCHFFAGIGGWSLALRLSGWPDEEPVWTGSCPCQPFSCAGQRKGHADERHLWPAFYRLIAECKPSTVFGEQVAGPDGREWLAGIRTDLEGAGYAVGAADLCAACVGAPHRRQRLYWVANSKSNGLARTSVIGHVPRANGTTSKGYDDHHKPDNAREAHRVVQSDRARSQSGCETSKTAGHWNTAIAAGFWSDAKEVEMCHPRTGERCKRRISAEPLFFPLADGLQPARVDGLRGAGNAIVPQVGALFIEAACDGLR